VEAGGAAGDADGVPCPDPSTRLRANVGGEALLELGNAGTDAKVGGLEHPGYRLNVGGGEVGG